VKVTGTLAWPGRLAPGWCAGSTPRR